MRQLRTTKGTPVNGTSKFPELYSQYIRSEIFSKNKSRALKRFQSSVYSLYICINKNFIAKCIESNDYSARVPIK